MKTTRKQNLMAAALVSEARRTTGRRRHPHQQDSLRKHPNSYVAFGCGSSKRLILVPFSDFEPWLEAAWTTTKGDRTYWHIVIYRKENKYTLRRKKGEKTIDLTPYALPEEV